MQKSWRQLKTYLWLAISLVSIIYLFWSTGLFRSIILVILGIISSIVGALTGFLVLLIARLIKKLNNSQIWIWVGTTLGSMIGAVNFFAVGCRLVAPYCDLTLNNPQQLGDDFGLIPFGIVVFVFVPMGIVFETMVGGIWGNKVSRSRS
jgi:hypothetical protein